MRDGGEDRFIPPACESIYGGASDGRGCYSRARVVFGFHTALALRRSLHDQKLKAFSMGLIDEGRSHLESLPFGGISHEEWMRGADSPEKTYNSRLPRSLPRPSEFAEMREQLHERWQNAVLDEPAHVMLGTRGRSRATRQMVPHRCTEELPARSLHRLTDDLFVVSAELAMCQAMHGEGDFIRELQLLWEACGTYCTKLTGVSTQKGALYELKPLTDPRKLLSFCRKNPSVRGSGRVLRCGRFLEGGSASPRETDLALLLGLHERYGGFGLGIPKMNWVVEASEEARAISGKNSFRCDLCWPEAKIDVEYQSDLEHRGEASRIDDSRRANALMAMGWSVIGVTNSEASSLSSINAIAESVRRRLRLPFRSRIGDLADRRSKLCSKLGLAGRW